MNNDEKMCPLTKMTCYGNIMVFASQSEHMKWHLENDPRYRRGGDAT